MSRSVVGILLAAGQGRRFGADKLLHPLSDGTPLAVASARHLVAVLPDTLAVVADGNDALVELLQQEGVRVVVNRRAADGVGSSIACGVAASTQAAGWVIALADMPCIPEAIIQQIAAGLRQGSDIIAPLYGGQRGHPVGFSKRHADALMRLDADQGARSIIATHSDRLDLIETHEQGVIIDIDAMSDLDRSPGKGNKGCKIIAPGPRGT